jgi:hypothetical protein
MFTIRSDLGKRFAADHLQATYPPVAQWDIR